MSEMSAPPIEPCCADLDNRESRPTGKDDLTLEVCRVCGRRHFTLTMDTGRLGVAGVAMGKPS